MPWRRTLSMGSKAAENIAVHGMIDKRQSQRNYPFDLMRLVFATMVLLAHAFELTDGSDAREVLHHLTRSSMNFGKLGVDGFFLLSGYLIVKSWLGDAELANFLRKRVLRIVPGYLVAVVLSTLVVGLLAPGVRPFFGKLNVEFIKSVVLLTQPATPPVFPGQPFAAVNGAMYTIAYEFRCYLLVALLGVTGALRRPIFCLAVTIVLLSCLFYQGPLERLHWPRPSLFGVPVITLRLTGIYLVGVCFYLFRSRVPYRRSLALAAAAGMMVWIAVAPSQSELALVVTGSYLLFYFSQAPVPWLDGMRKLPDISYGMYLYGWPVESLWIWFHRGSPWVCFFASTVICVPLGWLSWHFIERPALALKRKPTAMLPAA